VWATNPDTGHPLWLELDALLEAKLFRKDPTLGHSHLTLALGPLVAFGPYKALGPILLNLAYNGSRG
jgi:hypothetical protein